MILACWHNTCILKIHAMFHVEPDYILRRAVHLSTGYAIASTSGCARMVSKMNTDLAKAIAWADAEFARRTKAIEDGVVKLDWLVPEYRVTVTEILSYADHAGLTIDPLELRWELANRPKKRRRN